MRFSIVADVARVNGFVYLPHVRVDAELSKEGIHTKGAGFVRDDGDEQFANVFVAGEFGKQTRKSHGRRGLTVACTFEGFVKYLAWGCLDRFGPNTSAGQISAEFAAAL